MSSEQLQQALDLYKVGDLPGAEKILRKIVHDDPKNAEAWYGLATCAPTPESKKICLENCLAVFPGHMYAQKAYQELLEKQQTSAAAYPKTGSTGSSVSFPQPEVRQEKNTGTRRAGLRSLSIVIFILSIIILTGFVIWQFIRIERLEKAVQILTSELDRTTSLANNLALFAHSHSYSDNRLKTRVVEISGPVEKISKIRGVYYQWNTTDFPQFGFDDTPQLGVIAQEVEAVFPELVTTDVNGYLQVDYEKLTAVLIEGVKEQQKEIDTLSDRLDQIEGK